ncbi:MAG: cell division protein FtsQ/DivIB [Pseudomonadota bacterium]
MKSLLNTQISFKWPSRQSLKWQLKRHWRILITIVSMALLLVSVLLLWYSGMASHLAFQSYQHIQKSLYDRGLGQYQIEIAGIDYLHHKQIVELLDFEAGQTILELDLEKAKKNLINHGWIEKAQIKRQLSGLVQIDIVEQNPVAIWLNNGKKMLINKKGQVIAPYQDDVFEHLILVSGENAHIRFNQLHQAITQLTIGDDLTALNLIEARYQGRRRWDLFFSNQVRVLLPELDEIEALKIFKQIDPDIYFIDQTLQYLDLRLIDRLVAFYGDKKTDFQHYFPVDRPAESQL